MGVYIYTDKFGHASKLLINEAIGPFKCSTSDTHLVYSLSVCTDDKHSLKLFAYRTLNHSKYFREKGLTFRQKCIHIFSGLKVTTAMRSRVRYKQCPTSACFERYFLLCNEKHVTRL